MSFCVLDCGAITTPKCFRQDSGLLQELPSCDGSKESSEIIRCDSILPIDDGDLAANNCQQANCAGFAQQGTPLHCSFADQASTTRSKSLSKPTSTFTPPASFSLFSSDTGLETSSSPSQTLALVTGTSQAFSSQTSSQPASTTASQSSQESSGSSPETSNPQTKSRSSSTGISSGAAAGIGIGCALLGAILASLIFLFFFMRYKKRNRQEPVSAYAQHVGTYPESNSHEKMEMVAVTSAVPVVDNYLPQPVADDAIIGDLSRLRDNIRDHVQSYYHLSPVKAQLVDQARLQDIAAGVGIPSSMLKELLLEPSSRLLVIRLYLAWLILSRCDGNGQARSSFLPEEVAYFAPLISGVDPTNKGQVALASKWRSISGTLLQSRYGRQQPGEDDVLEHSIRQAIIVADSVLTPFIPSPSEVASDKRLQNLQGIMRRASQFAFILFSQPSDWAFDWAGGSRAQQGGLVVFPGLLQTVTDDGQTQRPPRHLTEPEVISGF